MKTKLTVLTLAICLSHSITSWGQLVPRMGSTCVPQPSTLVGWWPGDGSGKDIVGTDDATVVNASFSLGYIDQAFSFEAPGSYVRMPSAWATITYAFALEAWVWHGASPAQGQAYLTAAADPNGTDSRVQVLYDTSGTNKGFTFVLKTHDGTQSTITVDKIVEVGQWYHLVASYDGSQQQFFVNGAQAGVKFLNQPFGYAPQEQLILNSPASAGVKLLIDEVALYNRPLGSDEVLEHYTAGSAGMCKGPAFVKLAPAGVGNLLLGVKGQPGKTLIIQTSTDLKAWQPMTTITNFSGNDQAFDSGAGKAPLRFYRAQSQ